MNRIIVLFYKIDLINRIIKYFKMSVWQNPIILSNISGNFIHAKDWKKFALVNKSCYKIYKNHIMMLRYKIPDLEIFKLCYQGHVCPKCFQTPKKRSNHKCTLGDHHCDICKKSYYKKLRICSYCKDIYCRECMGWCDGCDHNFCPPCLTYKILNYKDKTYCPDCVIKLATKCYRCSQLYCQTYGYLCPDCRKPTCQHCTMWCSGCERSICLGTCAFDSRIETFLCKKCQLAGKK